MDYRRHPTTQLYWQAEGDFEGALKEAIPTLSMMDSLG